MEELCLNIAAGLLKAGAGLGTTEGTEGTGSRTGLTLCEVSWRDVYHTYEEQR
jgi:hypothetical protein